MWLDPLHENDKDATKQAHLRHFLFAAELAPPCSGGGPDRPGGAAPCLPRAGRWQLHGGAPVCGGVQQQQRDIVLRNFIKDRVPDKGWTCGEERWDQVQAEHSAWGKVDMHEGLCSEKQAQATHNRTRQGTALARTQSLPSASAAAPSKTPPLVHQRPQHAPRLEPSTRPLMCADGHLQTRSVA